MIEADWVSLTTANLGCDNCGRTGIDGRVHKPTDVFWCHDCIEAEGWPKIERVMKSMIEEGVYVWLHTKCPSDYRL